jgi:hypothetical protein
MCTCCVRGVDAVDAAPKPRPRPLSAESAVLCVMEATRAAMARPAADMFPTLCERIDATAPHDPTSLEGDAWFRTGLGMGTRDGWYGRSARTPPDLPPGVPTLCFNLGWMAGCLAVQLAKMETR